MSLASVEPEVLIDLMDLTAAELERRAEHMLKLSKELTNQSMRQARLAALPAERSLASGGVVVTEVEAIQTARELREFTRQQFAQALGLSASGVSRWLAKLIDRENPIIKREQAGGYAYIDPAPIAELRTERPRRQRRARATAAAGGQTFGLSGTGHDQQLKGVHKDLVPIVREAMADGWKLSRGGGGTGHWALTRTGQRVGFASTPRNSGDAASQLRQHLARANRASRAH
jgi:DNA-binding transcriptional regulator YiaG